MILTSLVLGRDPASALPHRKVGGWLDRSRQGVPDLVDSPFEAAGRAVPLWARPLLWAGVVTAVSLALVFYVFW
jgi:hypothetical protein